MKIEGMGRLLAAAVLTTGSVMAQAALQDRDLNGNGVIDAFHDTDLDMTWLCDANVNGRMTWDPAISWAEGFGFGGYGDRRLPTSDLSCVFGTKCLGGEMSHLWYVELGNSVGELTNTGGFRKLARRCLLIQY